MECREREEKPPPGAHDRSRYSTAVALDPASLQCLQNRARASLRMHVLAGATGSAIKASYRFALMKIYFGFTVAGDRSSIDAARKIVAMLQEKGHEVLTEHLVRDNAWSQDRLIPAQQVYQRDMKWLEQCDFFLAEVSGSSFGLGFEAGYLLGGSSKRVILLYKREIADKISLLITGNSHPNCILVPYTDVVELEKFVNDHV